MAEDVKDPQDSVNTGDQKPPEAPKPFDAEAFGKQVMEQTAQQVAAALARGQEPPPATPQVPQDALAEIIAPYARQASARAELMAALASDKADFYTSGDPDDLAERLELKEEIERRSDVLARAGRALPRVDIMRHLIGEKAEEVVKKRQERRAKRAAPAYDAQDLAADGVSNRPGPSSTLTMERAWDLASEDKLEKALENKAF